jgi:6-phosphogluconate dehydrogenase
MTSQDKAQFGMVGLAVMGRNLALNVLDHGYRVAGYNRRPELTDGAVAESGGKLLPTRSLQELLGTLERPRRIMLMVKAGEPVDEVMEQLRPLLEPGDIVIDGGNSWYEDTQRREKSYAAAGLRFIGMGVSGGEEGARFGPSLMPGGDTQAYAALQPLLEAISAKTDAGPCVTHVGPDGAGHFVKMVHNGIEYADMQLIAEAYDVLARLGGLGAESLAAVFDEWNRGPLESFLIEITAKVFKVRDAKTGRWLVDEVLDQAGQKGTGKWTAIVGLELGVPVPSIAAAIDARVLSSMKTERGRASRLLRGPDASPWRGDIKDLIGKVHDALFASKIVAYAQGLALIDAASEKYGWAINLREMARIWKGGCIIRARLLDTIMRAYGPDPRIANLLLDDEMRKEVHARQTAWREVVGLAQRHGIPVAGMAASLGYYDAYRSADLPQNLTQAQRDAFGSHTYQRKDDPEGSFVHTDWLR